MPFVKGEALHPCQAHGEGKPSLGGHGSRERRGTTRQLPVVVWLTLLKPEGDVVFWMHPTWLKVMISGQANLFVDSVQAPKSQNKINDCFTKCLLDTYYDSQ